MKGFFSDMLFVFTDTARGIRNWWCFSKPSERLAERERVAREEWPRIMRQCTGPAEFIIEASRYATTNPGFRYNPEWQDEWTNPGTWLARETQGEPHPVSKRDADDGF